MYGHFLGALAMVYHQDGGPCLNGTATTLSTAKHTTIFALEQFSFC